MSYFITKQPSSVKTDKYIYTDVSLFKRLPAVLTICSPNEKFFLVYTNLYRVGHFWRCYILARITFAKLCMPLNIHFMNCLHYLYPQIHKHYHLPHIHNYYLHPQALTSSSPGGWKNYKL